MLMTFDLSAPLLYHTGPCSLQQLCQPQPMATVVPGEGQRVALMPDDVMSQQHETQQFTCTCWFLIGALLSFTTFTFDVVLPYIVVVHPPAPPPHPLPYMQHIAALCSSYLSHNFGFYSLKNTYFAKGDIICEHNITL